MVDLRIYLCTNDMINGQDYCDMVDLWIYLCTNCMINGLDYCDVVEFFIFFGLILILPLMLLVDLWIYLCTNCIDIFIHTVYDNLIR
jgi:hypothetical protein